MTLKTKRSNSYGMIGSLLSYRGLALSIIGCLAMMQGVLAKDLPGASQTSYGVGASGAFSFNIPIVMPTGRNGMQPNLSLGFSSGGGNGSVGVGWGVRGLGAITRCGKTFATNGKRIGVQHNNDDRFCLNGQQLILISGSYGAANSVYRTEVDQIAHITAKGAGSNDVNGGTSPTYWEVKYKNGQEAEFGNNATSQFKLPGTTSVHSWKLNKISDKSGNYYTVGYVETQRLPRVIDYAGGHKVLFNYETRPDVRSGYIVGKKITRNKRLDSITIEKGTTTLRQYDLDYEIAPVTKRSRLTSVEECGLNGTCLPPIAIDWKTQTEGFSTSTATDKKAPDDLIEYYTYTRQLGGNQTEPNSIKEIRRGTWVDVDGDGEQDMVIAYTKPDGTEVKKTYINNGNGWFDQSNWHLPRTLRDYSDSVVNAIQARFLSPVINKGQLVDVNGDGLVDLVYSYKFDTTVGQSADPANIEEITETYINTGSGWGAPVSTWAPKDIIYDYIVNQGAGTYQRIETVRGRLMDLDGDGLVDWVRAYYDFIGAGTGNVHTKTWLNNGNGWTADASYDMPDPFVQYRHQWSIPRGTFVDVNGDGLQDWLRAYHPNTESAHFGTWLNRGKGTGWEEQTTSTYNAPERIYHNDHGWNDAPPTQTGYFVDVNGDGLRDWVKSYEAVDGVIHKGTRLNTGKGWAAWESSAGLKPKFVFENGRYSAFERGWPKNVHGSYRDVNRDGLVDYVESFKTSATGFAVSKKAWINNGTTWVEEPAGSPYIPTRLYFDYSGRDNAKANFGQFLDIDHDGATDWAEARAGSTRQSRIANIGKVDQVEKITTTMGVEVSPTFLPLTDNDVLYERGTEPEEDDSLIIERPMYVASELSTSAGNGAGVNVTTYKYTGAQVHRKGRGFLGFKTFESTNVATGIRQKNTYRQDYPYIGSVEESIVSEAANSNSNEWLSKTTNTYNKQNLNSNKTVFPYLWTTTSEKDELDSNVGQIYQWAKTTNLYEAGNYGRMQRSITEVGSGTAAAAADIQNHTKVEYTYHPADTTNWLVALVKDTTTTTWQPNVSGSTKIRKDAFTYYSGNGRLHKTTREPDSTDTAIKLITTYGYDAYGNINEEKVESTGVGAETRVNKITYSSATSYRLPWKLTNALNQDSFVVYHPQCDTPSKVTSIDGQDTDYLYDDFCRQTSVTASTNVTQTTDYSYAGQPSNFSTASCGINTCPVSKKLSMTTSVTGQPPVTTYYNLYSKPFLSVTNGMGVGQVINQETEYDSLGRVERQSQPYFNGESKHWTKNYYDLLGRVTKTTLPYSNAEVTTTFSIDGSKRQKNVTLNALGHPKTSFANALGQIVEIKDAYSNSLTYDYDSQGNLVKTSDAVTPNPNNIIVTYDKLGRRTKLNDPDMGLVTYTLDAYGQQRTQTDAKNQTLTMRYDKLGRLKERDVPLTSAATSPIETSYFDYDNGTTELPNSLVAIGKLGSVRKGLNGQQQNAKHFGYDAQGRLDATVTYIKGQRFTEALTYNANGQLDSRDYPSSGGDTAATHIRFAVKYDYINGYLSEISGIDAAGAKCITHWKADEYDALGRTKVDTLGNIVTTTRTYDPAQGVLKNIESIVNVGYAGTVQDIDYVYDDNNNLESRNDGITSVFESFGYDNLDRLTSHIKGSETVEVNYDAIGNITYKSDVGDYSYNGQGGPHAVSLVNSITGMYDPMAKFQVNWEWNGEQIDENNDANYQVNITNSAYQYDANGNITLQGNRSVLWTTFDKPESIMVIGQDGTQRGSLIEYDAEFNRHYKQEGVLSVLGSVASIKESTYYVGKEYEKIEKQNGEVLHRYTISTGGGTVQIERADGTNVDKPMYMLGDNLGSTNVIINALGEVEQRLAFDPWGARTNAGAGDAVNGVTNRGYTGHEMDDEVGLVNMNARIYDPVLGRFLSADPVLPDAYDTQQFNRYSYVMNNPLKYTDPTGHCADGVSTSACAVAVATVIDYAYDYISGLFGQGSRFDDFEGDIHNLGEVLDFLYDGNPPEGGAVEDSGFDEEQIAIIVGGSPGTGASSGSSNSSQARDGDSSGAISSGGASAGSDTSQRGNGSRQGFRGPSDYQPPGPSCNLGGCSIFDENGDFVLYAGRPHNQLESSSRRGRLWEKSGAKIHYPDFSGVLTSRKGIIFGGRARSIIGFIVNFHEESENGGYYRGVSVDFIGFSYDYRENPFYSSNNGDHSLSFLGVQAIGNRPQNQANYSFEGCLLYCRGGQVTVTDTSPNY